MTNEEICAWLKAEAEPKFQKFTSGLIPGTDPIIGVRIPKLRTLAKKIAKEDWRGYLEHAACDTYEEIMLQGLVLGYAKGEIDELLEYVRAFIPKIHDWSVNDCFCATFKIAQKHREKVWNFLMPYAKSDQEFEQRVVSVMLMDHFLTEEYIARVLSGTGSTIRDITGKWELRGALQLHMQSTQRKHMHFYWRIIWMTKHTIRRSRK